MTLPRFILGHNALIGVNHRDRASAGVKRELTPADTSFLDEAARLGVEGIILDNHPVALQAARHLARHHPQVQVLPMIPYAQAVVDAASKGGLSGIVRDMASTSASMGPAGLLRSAGRMLAGDVPGAGANVALAHYLRGFPSRRPRVCFLHNAVTDLLLAWDATGGLAGFARACRARGIVPGFVTLNGGSIPRLSEIAGAGAWFMCAVNSKGIQMSPSRDAVENVLRDPMLNVVAMSVLGGGMLDPAREIPRTLAFPAVKSVVIGTSRTENLKALMDLVGAAQARGAAP